MMSFQPQAADLLWKYRYLLVLLCLAITAAAATQLATLRVSNSLDMWYPQDAIRRSGGSLVMTSLVLCGGFLVMGLAEIRTVAWFGLLTSCAMASAILTDRLLLPALATTSRRAGSRRNGCHRAQEASSATKPSD